MYLGKGSATPIELYKDTVGEEFPQPGEIVDRTLDFLTSSLLSTQIPVIMISPYVEKCRYRLF